MSYALDVLVVPGFELVPDQNPKQWGERWPSEIALIRRAAARSLPLASVCVGAFLLAESGVLDGRRATTAWLFAETLARHYPTVTVDLRSLIVEDGLITTTGAFTAAADLALRMVRLTAGEAIMRTTARITLTTGRTSQAPYVDERLLGATAGSFSLEVRHYLSEKIDSAYNLPAIAAAHHVSTRTLLRRFRAETGQTPLSYLQSLRVSRARHALESTELNIEEIARSVGYQDVSTFRQLFARTVGLSPSAYRRSFGNGL
jgi:transcriptional regulator GlxA family with amidase domain